MDVVRKHWITALAVLGTGFLLVVGIALMITGGDESDNGVRVFGVFGFLGGLSLLGGLWGLQQRQLTLRAAHILIVVGLVVLGGGFWWFVLLPAIVALIVLYAGVIRQGLVRELQPT